MSVSSASTSGGVAQDLHWIAFKESTPPALRAKLVSFEVDNLPSVVYRVCHPSLVGPLVNMVLTASGKTTATVVVELRAEGVVREVRGCGAT